MDTRRTPLLSINCSALLTFDSLWMRILPRSGFGSCSPEMISSSSISLSPLRKSSSIVSICVPALRRCELHQAANVCNRYRSPHSHVHPICRAYVTARQRSICRDRHAAELPLKKNRHPYMQGLLHSNHEKCACLSDSFTLLNKVFIFLNISDTDEPQRQVFFRFLKVYLSFNYSVRCILDVYLEKYQHNTCCLSCASCRPMLQLYCILKRICITVYVSEVKVN